MKPGSCPLTPTNHMCSPAHTHTLSSAVCAWRPVLGLWPRTQPDQHVVRGEAQGVGVAGRTG